MKLNLNPEITNRKTFFPPFLIISRMISITRLELRVGILASDQTIINSSAISLAIAVVESLTEENCGDDFLNL